jgi:choline dehydrogenase
MCTGLREAVPVPSCSFDVSPDAMRAEGPSASARWLPRRYAMHDYVVVGAGSAGCVMASRLSEDPTVRVLLLEAGPRDTHAAIRVPAAFSKLFRTALDWNYATEPEPELRDRRLYWPRGRVLGGSSSMNAMIWARGHQADYEEWVALGATGWAWADVLPYFRRAERCERGAADHRGCAGPVYVSELRAPNPATRAFVAAAQQAGIPRSHDINAPGEEGVDLVQVTQRRGARWSAADAYTKAARARPNLQVVTGAHATRIVLDGCRAVAVEYRHAERLETAAARHEIVVSAGAVNSPQLLMLSGIGPAGHLRTRGIAPVRDLPGVGRNLQDHLAAGVVVECLQRVTLVTAESRANLLRYLLLGQGPLTSNVAEAIAFRRSSPSLAAPDYEMIFAPVPFVDHGLVRPRGHGLTVGVVLLRPASRGQVGLRSADPFDPPAIEARYLSDAGGHDLRVLVTGLAEARQVLSMPALAPYVGAEIEPGAIVRTDAQLGAFVREQAETLYHPVGTCRMGTDSMAVVDPELRVHGVEGLRVADASVMPTVIRGHTHAPAVMIGERAADLIAAARAPARRAVEAARVAAR